MTRVLTSESGGNLPGACADSVALAMSIIATERYLMCPTMRAMVGTAMTAGESEQIPDTATAWRVRLIGQTAVVGAVRRAALEGPGNANAANLNEHPTVCRSARPRLARCVLVMER